MPVTKIMSRRCCLTAISRLKTVMLCNVAFKYMPFGYAVVTKKEVATRYEVWPYAFCQCIYIVRVIVKWFYRCNPEWVLSFFMYIFRVYHSRFIARHGIVRVHWQ